MWVKQTRVIVEVDRVAVGHIDVCVDEHVVGHAHDVAWELEFDHDIRSVDAPRVVPDEVAREAINDGVVVHYWNRVAVDVGEEAGAFVRAVSICGLKVHDAGVDRDFANAEYGPTRQTREWVAGFRDEREV